MSVEQQILNIVSDVLGLDRDAPPLRLDSGLLGHRPEFDSMAVVAILTAIEDNFDVSIDDSEVDAAIFESVGSLVAFVSGKVDQ